VVSLIEQARAAGCAAWHVTGPGEMARCCDRVTRVFALTCEWGHMFVKGACDQHGPDRAPTGCVTCLQAGRDVQLSAVSVREVRA
jgi:hypothetical protein